MKLILSYKQGKMTLLEIRNQIVGLFVQRDTFIIPDHLDQIQVSESQKGVKLELVKLALADLKESKFCQAILSENGEQAIYTLSSPIYSDGQDIRISMPTANAVAEIVNSYAEQLGDDSMICDKMSIQDQDIQFLCLIIGNLLEAQPMPGGGLGMGDEE